MKTRKPGHTRAIRTLTSLGATALLAAGVAACASSSTSTANSSATAKASPASMSGIETATGQVTGAAALANNLSIPVTWTGPVVTTGTFDGGGNGPAKGQHHTFKTAAGNLAVVVSATPTNVQKVLSASSCQFEFVTTVPYRVDGAASTGKFAGSAGSGVVAVNFRAYLPKLASGKCNESNSAQPLTKGAIAVFKGTGPLTIKP
jgi:hypothetical protein